MGYTLTTSTFGFSAMSPKNRVWEFFPLSNTAHPATRRQPAQPRRKIGPTPTKSASGIPCWPSRDPIEEEGGINLYDMVNNDPVNGGDFLGMLVTATYNIRQKHFWAVDNDTDESVECGKDKCSCGTNNEKETGKEPGPLPKGTYSIYQWIKGRDSNFKHLGNAWILDPQDANKSDRGDDIEQRTKRYSFRIHLWVFDHPKGRKGSDGCMVLNKDCYTEFNKLLSKTKPGAKKSIKSPLTWDKNGKVTSWEYFDSAPLLGTLTVN